MLMRTHVEVDPKVGLRGLEGVKALIERYRWAIDIEICVMPQEGLINNPGTDELMVAALENGATVVGAAPNYDSDRTARSAASSSLHDATTSTSTCTSTAAPRPMSSTRCWSVTSPSSTAGRARGDRPRDQAVRHAAAGIRCGGKRMADAGVALTVLPATDLYLGGREKDHRVERSVVDANRLIRQGVLCSVSSNNILNAFTPLGDGQLIRMANLYANVVQQAMPDAELRDTWGMFTNSSAKLMRRRDYGIAVGNPLPTWWWWTRPTL